MGENHEENSNTNPNSYLRCKYGKKNMKRTMILAVAIGLAAGNMQAMEQVKLLTSDNQEFMLDASRIEAFGTIKDLVGDTLPRKSDGTIDYAGQGEPIELSRVSHAASSNKACRLFFMRTWQSRVIK